MSWTPDELTAINKADELRIASHRPDGTLRPYTIIWHSALDGQLYIRSAHGPDNGWFKRALAAGSGRISAGGVEKDVTFVLAQPGIRADLDSALHQKYDRYGPSSVGAITGDDVLETTLLVTPSE